MPKKLILSLALLTGACGLNACGQKGPLYLPQDAAAPAQPQATAAAPANATPAPTAESTTGEPEDERRAPAAAESPATAEEPVYEK